MLHMETAELTADHSSARLQTKGKVMAEMGKQRESSFSKRRRPLGNKLALMSNGKLYVGSRER